MSDPDRHSWHFGGGVPKRSNDRQRGLSPGERFDERFVISEVLGLGGMGVVYRAHDTTTGRDVALKVLRGQIDDRRRERLRREGELTAALSHPGIVRIHSAGEVEGAPYLAYELVEGSPLSWEALDARDLSERVSLLIEIARAVGHAHAHGVVHRDLKPDNVLIDADGRVRVTDFGLGWTQTVERLTQTGALVGTPRYMSPEQATGSLDAIGPASDVWALGVMLYRALTGAFPFTGERLLELQAQVCQAEPPRPRAMTRQVSMGLEAVCLKCLSKARGDRYPDAGALATDLANALDARPVSAPTTSWWRTPSTRRGRSLILAGLTLLGLGGALAVPTLRTQSWEEEVRDRLGKEEAEGEQRGALEDALEDPRSQGLPPELRARIHLLLASGSAQTPEGWQARADHARRARELSPEDPASGERALGRALMGLGEPREAAKAFSRARAAGANWDVALDQLAALLEAGDLDEVESGTEELVQTARWRDRALRLVVPGLLERGELERARRIVGLVPTPAHSQEGLLLWAAVERSADRDPLTLLEGVVARSPERAEANIAVILHLLDEGEIEAAASVARKARDREVEGRIIERLARLLEACTASPPGVMAVRGEEETWREAIARWWLAQGERDVAFLGREARPDSVPNASSLSAVERRRRAQRAFEWALGCEPGAAVTYRARVGLAHLFAPGDAARRRHVLAAIALRPGEAAALLLSAEDRNAVRDPKGALAALGEIEAAPTSLRSEIAWEQGSALLALGNAPSAVPLLEAALGAEPVDRSRCAVLLRALEGAGRGEHARVLRERIDLLAGSQRAEAEAEYQQIVEARRSKSGGEIIDMALAAGRVLERDPLNVGARYHLGLGLYMQGDREEGLRACLKAASCSPPLLRQAQRLVLTGRIPNWVLRESALRFDDRDPLLQGFRRAMHVEQLGDARSLPAALRLMTQVLDEDPSETVAWVLRGFLQVRARRFVQGERDLRVAKEAAPDCSVIPFYEALLSAARGSTAEEVLERLEQARSLGYDLWHVATWRPEVYPELKAYLGVPGFKEVFKKSRVTEEDMRRGRLRGFFDGFRDGGVRGWAFDPGTSGESVTVRITIDGPPGVGRVIGDALANLKRGDVVHLLKLQGEFGFKFPLPPWARGHEVHASVLHAGGNGFTELEGSPRTWKAR